MNLNELVNRVKVEGKDSLDQHTTEIQNFIKDITREITTTYDFPWLLSEITLTTTGDWQALSRDIRQVKAVEADSLKINPISEQQYYFRKNIISNNAKSYYRTRWNTLSKKLEINFINIDADTEVNLLVRKYFDDVTKLPPELNEAVTAGAIYKYLSFLEGDDTSVAKEYKARYIELTQQHYHMLDVETQDDKDDRMMTNAEIEDALYGFHEDDD